MTRVRLFALLAVPLALAAAILPTSPVADAAMRGDIKTVTSLIAKGESVNEPRATA
jgi:hypothetical protein